MTQRARRTSRAGRGRRFAVAVAVAVQLAGCGGMAFHVVREEAPRIEPRGAQALWIAVDATDAISVRVAQRLATSLVDVAPTRVVAIGRPPESGVVVVTLALRRSVSHRPALVQQPVWSCDPTGTCYTRDVTRVVDLPVVRVLARLSVHEASGRALTRPIVLDRSESDQDELGAELQLVSQLAREIDGLFRARREALSLPVQDVEDPTARARILAALEAPSRERCDAIAQAAAPTLERTARARVLYAAGQCHRATAARASADGSAEPALRLAEAQLLSAMRLAPSERYARALDETRRWLSALEARRSPSLVPAGPDLPEPPPAYR